MLKDSRLLLEAAFLPDTMLDALIFNLVETSQCPYRSGLLTRQKKIMPLLHRVRSPDLRDLVLIKSIAPNPMSHRQTDAISP